MAASLALLRPWRSTLQQRARRGGWARHRAAGARCAAAWRAARVVGRGGPRARGRGAGAGAAAPVGVVLQLHGGQWRFGRAVGVVESPNRSDCRLCEGRRRQTKSQCAPRRGVRPFRRSNQPLPPPPRAEKARAPPDDAGQCVNASQPARRSSARPAAGARCRARRAVHAAGAPGGRRGVRRPEPSSAAAAMDISNAAAPTHLVVLVHGIWGWPSQVGARAPARRARRARERRGASCGAPGGSPHSPDLRPHTVGPLHAAPRGPPCGGAVPRARVGGQRRARDGRR
jgi:hypothetical protein